MKRPELYDPLPIVDAHHHLWDLEGDLAYPWLTSGEHSYQGDNSALRTAHICRRNISAIPPCITSSRRFILRLNAIGLAQVEETAWVSAQAKLQRDAQRHCRPCLD